MRRGALSPRRRADRRRTSAIAACARRRAAARSWLSPACDSPNSSWTRGAPKIFASSDFAERGFCADCGTPLTYRATSSDRIAVTLGSLDDAGDSRAGEAVRRRIEIAVARRHSALPVRDFTDHWLAQDRGHPFASASGSRNLNAARLARGRENHNDRRLHL